MLKGICALQRALSGDLKSPESALQARYFITSLVDIMKVLPDSVQGTVQKGHHERGVHALLGVHAGVHFKDLR